MPTEMNIEELRTNVYRSAAVTNGDGVHRIPVRPEEVWSDYDSIPNDVSEANLVNDGDAYEVEGRTVITLRKGQDLFELPGDYSGGARFGLADVSKLSLVVPASFGLRRADVGRSVGPTFASPAARATGYMPAILDAAGKTHYQTSSQWVVDGLNHFVAFPGGVPGGMQQPLKLTFVQYSGRIASAADAAAPQDVDLYVRADGDDAGGAGEEAAPYRTIERALEDLRATGWDETATVWVLPSLEQFKLPVGVYRASVGVRGAQRSPLTIKGTRSQVGTGTVTSIAAGASANALTFSGTFTGEPGQRIVHATTAGRGVDMVIHEIVAGAMTVSNFEGLADTGTYVVEKLDTTLYLDGNLNLSTGAASIVFEDLNVSTSGRVSPYIFKVADCTFVTKSVNFGGAFFIMTDNWTAGEQSASSMIGKSVYLDGTMTVQSTVDWRWAVSKSVYLIITGGSIADSFTYMSYFNYMSVLGTQTTAVDNHVNSGIPFNILRCTCSGTYSGVTTFIVGAGTVNCTGLEFINIGAEQPSMLIEGKVVDVGGISFVGV